MIFTSFARIAQATPYYGLQVLHAKKNGMGGKKKTNTVLLPMPTTKQDRVHRLQQKDHNMLFLNTYAGLEKTHKYGTPASTLQESTRKYHGRSAKKTKSDGVVGWSLPEKVHKRYLHKQLCELCE